jgi:hypothetical protein
LRDIKWSPNIAIINLRSNKITDFHGDIFPESLTELYFYTGFTQDINGIIFPETLKILHLNIGYRHSIINVKWPMALETFLIKLNHLHDWDYIKDSKYTDYVCRFDDNIDICWPQNLKHIAICHI